MRNETLDKLVWVLIYGGLLAAGLGVALLRQPNEALGWPLVAGGGLLVAVGVLLIGVRARRGGDR
jgi:hypothetical protein